MIFLTLALKNALVVSLVSRDIASTSGINVTILDLTFLLAFALTIALGIGFLGVLLMGSLIVSTMVGFTSDPSYSGNRLPHRFDCRRNIFGV